MSVMSLSNQTVTIVRKTQTQSATTGAKVSSWANTATGVECAVQMPGSSEDRLAARETGRVRYDVFFAYGTDIRTGDRITWGSRTLAVLGPPIDESGRESHYKITAEEIEGGGTL